MPGGVAWTSLVVAWGTLVTVFITASRSVDGALSDDKKEDIADWIQTNFPPYGFDWYKRTNQAFQDIFDKIYGFQGTYAERGVLSGILLIYPLLLINNLLAIGGTTISLQGTRPKILVAAALIVFGFLSFSLYQTVHWLKQTVDMMGRWCLEFFINYIKPNNRYDEEGYNILFNRIKTYSKIIYLIFILLVVIYLSLSPQVESNSAAAWQSVVSGFAAGIAVMAVVSVSEIFSSYDRDLVNPIRAMFSSLIFISLLSLIAPNARMTYIEEVGASGVFMVSFLAFNISADTISLMETRWILRKSRTASVRHLPILLISDLLLSFLIYLVLPVLVGQNLQEFWKAIQFSGPKPWIGILFWTTFSTSAIFYIFVVAIIIIQLQKPITRLITNALKVEEQPTLAIAIVISFLVTLIFLFIYLSRFVPF